MSLLSDSWAIGSCKRNILATSLRDSEANS
jgi:hypothetical protein